MHARAGETTCACGHEARSSHMLGAHIGGTRRAKVTADDVREMRRLHRTEGVSQRVLAERYGLDKSTVSHMMTGRSWKHVEEDI